MRGFHAIRGESLERWLRALCRCDGLKDLAVVAALLAIFGSLAVRLASAPAAVNSFS